MKKEKSSMEIVWKKTGELIPYVNNAKLHPDWQIQQIAGSIKEFGFMSPVLIDADNMILAGHGRIAAANILGLKDVPCIEAKHLSDLQKKAYIIADNKFNYFWELRNCKDLDVLNKALCKSGVIENDYSNEVEFWYKNKV
jgi:hypothetical protein